MVKLHKPTMHVLLETRMTEHKHLMQELGFSGQIQAPVVNFSGVIVISWNDDILKIDEVSTTTQGINVMVKVSPSSIPWLFTIIYAINSYANRRNLWDQLKAILDHYNGSWPVGRDFNEVLRAKDKQGETKSLPQ